MTTPGTVLRYEVGALAHLRATVLGTAGTPADPSQFAFHVMNPQPRASVATYIFGVAGASITRIATGAYVKDIVVDFPGEWYYRAVASGLVQSAEGWTFVGKSKFVL